MAISINQQRAHYRAIAPSIIGTTARFFYAQKTTPGSYNPYELDEPPEDDWGTLEVLSGVEVFNLRQERNESRGNTKIMREPQGVEDCPRWKLTVPNTAETRSLQNYSQELYAEIIPVEGSMLSTVRGRVESIQPKKTGIVRIVIKAEDIPV